MKPLDFLMLLSLPALCLQSCDKRNYDWPGRPEPDPIPEKVAYSPMLFNLEFEKNLKDATTYKFGTQPEGGGISYSEAGKKGCALKFAGDSRFKINYLSRETKINMKDTLAVLDDFTLSVWLKPESNGIKMSGIIDFENPSLYDGPLVVGYQVDGNIVKFLVAMRNGKEATNDYWNLASKDEIWYEAATFLNNWHHMVLRYDSETSTLTYFLDNEKKREKVMTAFENGADTGQPLGKLSWSNLTSQIWVGATHFGEGEWATYYKGEMDELRFYRLALSDEEIADLYNLNY